MDDMRVPIPKLPSRMNSVAWFSPKMPHIPNLHYRKANATTELTTIEIITVNNRKYHHSASRLPLKVE